MKAHPMQLAMAAGLSALALFVTACSAGSAPDSSGGAQQDSGGEEAKKEDCLREKGFGVQKGDEGKRAMSLPDGMGPDEASKIMKECGFKEGLGGGGSEVSQEEKDKMLNYAACMRKEGIDMPDPKFEGGAVSGRAMEADSEAYKKADKVCAQKAGM